MNMRAKVNLREEIFNVVNENVKALERLFPSAVKDGQVDFQALKEELGQFEEVDPEKYGLTWSGKQNAKKIAQQDISGKTLKYIPEDSKNPDTTENLYIEGDNLEVLKLLRQNYYGAIKMIYIDPPYNTGNDFVYNDNFSMDKSKSDIEEGYVSELGERYTVNSKGSNKYHANWLNMMYPRLKIAKDLLTEDGVIFISIGSEEIDNLMKICNEIFGENNRLGVISRITKTASNNGTFFAPSIDYIICLARDSSKVVRFSDKVDESLYKKVETTGEKKGEKYRDDIAFYQSSQKDLRPNQKYFVEAPDGTKLIPPCSIQDEIMREGDGRWRWSKEKYLKEKELLVFKKTSTSPLMDEYGNKAKWNVYTKSYLKEREENGTLPREIWQDFINRKGADLLKKMEIPFDFSKPVELIEYILQIINTSDSEECIVLDFFSGSSTTAHAVIKSNLQDNKNRQFIMVQMSEIVDEKSIAYKEGYKNICEIGKERIRRAGEKIKEENKDKEGIENLDIGFKVFRVSDTNIRWSYEYDTLKTLANETTSMSKEDQSTFDFIAATSEQVALDEVVSPKDRLDFMPGTKDIDVVYEILLRQRDIPLSAKVEFLENIGKRTYIFADSYVVCLETEITEELIERLAAINPLPIKYILRDSAFGDDIELKDESYRRLQALIERNTGESKKAYTVEFI